MSYRQVQADDALENLRLALKYKDTLTRNRTKFVYSNRNATRSKVLLDRVSDLVKSRAATYRVARAAMIALGLPEKSSQYPELLEEQVVLKVVAGEKKLGEGKYTGSWIWGNGSRGVMSDKEEDEWEEEGP